MVGERYSPLRIGEKSMQVAPIGKCFRIDVCANSDIASTLNLFALPLNKSFPVLKSSGHILGIGKYRKRPTVSELVIKPSNSYDLAHSETPFVYWGTVTVTLAQNNKLMVTQHLMFGVIALFADQLLRLLG
jgi:hypothetical protein